MVRSTTLLVRRRGRGSSFRAALMADPAINASGTDVTIQTPMANAMRSIVHSLHPPTTKMGDIRLGYSVAARARRFRCQRIPPSMAARIVSLSRLMLRCTRRSKSFAITGLSAS